MAKKNFENVNTDALYTALDSVTAEAPATEAKKERTTYTETEKAKFNREMKTAGHKGCKLQRLNLAFSDDLYQYVKVMSRIRGEKYSEFIANILRANMEENAELYESALKIIEAF